jgi:hypothetical protein
MASYFNNLRVFNAEQFKKAVIDNSASLYVTFGKTESWEEDINPPTANTDITAEIDIWKNMVGAKKVLATDFRHVVPRVTWTANTYYNQWDHQNTELTDFYVLTSNNNVYKCLSNNFQSKSTVMPVDVDTVAPVETTDGYLWKYLYTLSNEEVLRFLTDDYMPVRKIIDSDGSLQWQVQQATTEGAIYSIKITNGGDGYSNVSNLNIYVYGDGTGAAATATINTISNTVNSISMTTFGANYTTATVRITGGGGANAKATAILSPANGHGSDPIYELKASNLLLDMRVFGTEDDKYPPYTQFRQISLLKDPVKFGTSTVSTNTTVSQTYDMSMYNYAVSVGVPTDYNVNEIVYQGTSYSDSVFSARVAHWDAENNTVRTTQYKGEANTTESLYGLQTVTNKIVGSIFHPELEPNSGEILYVDNFTPITKDPDQIDDLKIVIKF